MIRLLGTLAGVAWVLFMAWGALREYQAMPPDPDGRRSLRDRIPRRLGFPKRTE